MKRVGGLFDRIADARTLTYAAWRAAAGKRERREVRSFINRLDEETSAIGREMRAGIFRFSGYRTFMVRDTKTRTIHAPSFRDRVAHHAVIAVIGPILERGAIVHSYACRAGFGQHAALRKARKWMRPDDWFWKADIVKYYDSIDHGLLRQALARRFRERRLLGLLDNLIESYSHSPGKGLPIGALTSQYFGNFFLDPFDRWVNQRCGVKRYMRYMDDMLAFGDLDRLRSLRTGAELVLEGLGLTAKLGGSLNRCGLGAPFLGFVLYPNRTRLNRLGRRRLRRRIGAIEKGFLEGEIGEAELRQRGESLFAHARHGDDVAWRRMVTRFTRIGETQEPESRDAGRFVEQHRGQVPVGVSQQEQAG